MLLWRISSVQATEESARWRWERRRKFYRRKSQHFPTFDGLYVRLLPVKMHLARAGQNFRACTNFNPNSSKFGLSVLIRGQWWCAGHDITGLVRKWTVEVLSPAAHQKGNGTALTRSINQSIPLFNSRMSCFRFSIDWLIDCLPILAPFFDFFFKTQNFAKLFFFFAHKKIHH